MTAIETELDQHFAFGENWADYAKTINAEKIDQATRSMESLLGTVISGKSFLDIGCGSGLHALAAVRLGASNVVAIDIDPNSVATTRQTLENFSGGTNWKVEEVSVLTPQFNALGKFDVVYSWGVLHHTGAMWDAIRSASDAVANDGTLCIALYAKTPLCGFWKIEKKIYSRSNAAVQAVMRSLFYFWFWLISSVAALKRRKLFSALKHMKGDRTRGMNFRNDAHDWLGGYPYESVSYDEVTVAVRGLGFSLVSFTPVGGGKLGLLGSGCDEYVFRRA